VNLKYLINSIRFYWRNRYFKITVWGVRMQIKDLQRISDRNTPPYDNAEDALLLRLEIRELRALLERWGYNS
jgi:hypothetical protein